MTKKIPRITIEPKDVSRITGKSGRHSRRIISKIRKHYKKEPHQFLSVSEFCSFVGLREEDVNRTI